MFFTDFENGIHTRLQDSAGKLSQADQDALLLQAIYQRYSKDRPRELVSDVPCSGTSDQALPAGPAGEQFEDGFSMVRSIEYPIGDLPETCIESGNWKMYRSPAGLKIRLLADTPGTAEAIRVAWTVRHNPGTAALPATIPDCDFGAVCDYAASLCAEALQAIYAQVGDSTLGADSVNYRSKGQEYGALAKSLRKRYYDFMGMEDGKGQGGDSGYAAGAALAIGAASLPPAAGVDWLTHRRSG